MSDHFIRDEKVIDPEKPMAKCNNCNHTVGVHHTRQGTSDMRSHLKGCLAYQRKQTLDPQLKLGWLRFWFSKTLGKEEGRVMSDLVRSTLDRLFMEYNVFGYDNTSRRQGTTSEAGGSSSGRSEYLESYNVEKDMTNNPTQLMSIISVSNTDSVTLDMDN
ncbi:hypothetical protein CJ030_MR3G017015 [Morella rubra]|uniref:BED-type domain-containing protein n=1 Tax=Morella rubra TaxID=262757 RepID=A0A6A1W4Q7_9ROSI|nr:hypothetical protein CJ030_MR3G017015 [Morella rubra]